MKSGLPMLYKLKNEGFVFNHYYTPGWYGSTSDGEYANLTGLLPTDGIVSMREAGENGLIICSLRWADSWRETDIR